MTFTAALTSALWDSIWQNALVALIAALVLRAMHRSTPRARYVVSFVFLVAMVAWPLVNVIERVWGRPLHPAVVASTNTAPVEIVIDRVPVFDDERFLPLPIVRVSPQIHELALPLWMSGVFLFAIRLIAANVQTRAIIKRSSPADESTCSVVEQFARRIGIHAGVRAITVAAGPGPATVGWLRPVILLPPAAALGMPAEQLEALIVHELAHIRRHDYIANTAQLVIESLFFYHPAVWWLSAVIRQEREACCDDMVVATTNNRESYVRALAALAARVHVAAPLALGSADGPLVRRIARLLGSRSSHAPISLPFAAGMIAIIVVASIAALQAGSQLPPAGLPDASFEVASIKPIEPSPDMQLGIRPINQGGRFSAVITLRSLIRVAYGDPLALLNDQVVGGPSWINTDLFEIIATPDGPLTDGTNSQLGRLMAMVRKLMADRFALRVREEMQEMPVYDLVSVNQNGEFGPSLRLAQEPCIDLTRTSGPMDFTRACGLRWTSPASFAGRRVTMEDLAAGLTHRSDIQRVVRNRTGLAGQFDFALEYMPFTAVATQGGPSLFTALKEQLGLELQASTGPVRVVVIEHAEKPSPN